MTCGHKTTGDVCSVLQMVDDRDETSDVNLGLSALKSIQGTGCATSIYRVLKPFEYSTAYLNGAYCPDLVATDDLVNSV